MPDTITTREKVMRFIEATTLESGCSPTCREIRVAVGLGSLNTVHYHLTQLEKDGRIIRKAGSKRWALRGLRGQVDLPTSVASLIREEAIRRQVTDAQVIALAMYALVGEHRLRESGVIGDQTVAQI